MKRLIIGLSIILATMVPVASQDVPTLTIQEARRVFDTMTPAETQRLTDILHATRLIDPERTAGDLLNEMTEVPEIPNFTAIRIPHPGLVGVAGGEFFGGLCEALCTTAAALAMLTCGGMTGGQLTLCYLLIEMARRECEKLC